jgi:catechol 2,3-dioxygenase-like lactoylglutathione lyase family enzyme
MKRLVAFAALALASCEAAGGIRPVTDNSHRRQDMDLGNFSVSLAVKNLEASRAFYQKLGFAAIGGDAKQNWLILQNGTTTIGLFQGMFDKNILTFNPGWTSKAERLPKFTDVRKLQRALKEQGIALTTEADEASKGPAHFTLVDPDGNAILVDQHVE